MCETQLIYKSLLNQTTWTPCEFCLGEYLYRSWSSQSCRIQWKWLDFSWREPFEFIKLQLMWLHLKARVTFTSQGFGKQSIFNLSQQTSLLKLIIDFPFTRSGVCREGDRLVVGPTDDGKFLRLKVCSIHRNRSGCRVLRAGQAATLALGNFDRSLLRKVWSQND